MGESWKHDESFQSFMELGKEEFSDNEMLHTSDEESDEDIEIDEETCDKESLLDAEIRVNKNNSNVASHSCKLCMKSFTSKWSLRRHSKMNSCIRKDKSNHECDICSKRFQESDELYLHMRNHKRERPYVCSTCGMDFKGKKMLQKHERMHISDKGTKFICSICEKSFCSNNYLNHHMNIHKGVRYPCTVCNKSFSHPRTLKKHMKLHNPGDSNKIAYIPCKVCQKLYISEHNLHVHMKLHSGMQQFQCGLCQAQFSSKRDLKRHLFIHTGEKPYACSQCPRTFRQLGDFKRHLAWHKGDHTCKYCQKKYCRKDELLRHMSKHETEQGIPTDNSLQCKYCQKFMSSDITLKMHIEGHERHDEIKDGKFIISKFECEQCGKKFSTRGNLYKHMRDVHTIERDSYDSAGDLSTLDSDDIYDTTVKTSRRHLKNSHQTSSQIVSNLKDDSLRYRCDLCSRTLKTKNSLREHMNYAHLQKFNFKCDLCGLKFYKSKGLRCHVQKYHNTA